LADLMIRAKLVTEKDVATALGRQRECGGRLGENLVAIGALDQKVLDKFIHRIPAEPSNIYETGIDEAVLVSLLMKLIYTGRLETTGQFAEAIKLPVPIVIDLAQKAVERRLVYALGSRDFDSPLSMGYALTEEGRRWTIDALRQSGYVGPAPVTLEQFTDRVNLQKPTNERITAERIQTAVSDLVLEDSIVEQVGPALNSGRAILLYGPPGNGKTSVALSFASVFHDVIYVPYAIFVEGQIIRFNDPSVHVPLSPITKDEEEKHSFIRRETFDQRWVSCRRPFVITGGELTLDMLDLRYDTAGHFYEAPLHMKALGGCFFIDDFGRQLVGPTHLLNRWIVPLESRVDYMKLHTGKTFSIPFEELVIFSTNLEPEDLMDPAFLRRLPYKIEVAAPDLDHFRRIFEKECQRQGLTLRDDVFNFIVYLLRDGDGPQLAAFHPRFIVDQVVATCRFLGKLPELKSPYVDYAINNLRIRRDPGAKGEAQRQPTHAQKLTRSGQPAETFEPTQRSQFTV
jgi:hypothetical protein